MNGKKKKEVWCQKAKRGKGKEKSLKNTNCLAKRNFTSHFLLFLSFLMQIFIEQ